MPIPDTQQLVHRLRRIRGQVEGLEKLTANDAYCPDVIRLSLAIQKSLQSFNQAMLEKHLGRHAAQQFRHGQGAKAIKELLDIYFLSNK